MIELFYLGGQLFMGILTTIFLTIFSFSIYQAIRIADNKLANPVADRHLFGYIKSLGLFALVTGFLGQLIGLYSAFDSIEEMGGVSQEMLVGGLKVSSITSLYGLVIFLISYVIWFGLDLWRSKKERAFA